MIAVPVAIALLWFAFFMVLIGADLISPLPAMDVNQMPPDVLAQYQQDQETSKLWETIWLTGLGIILVGGLISSIVGIMQILKIRRVHNT